MNGSNPEPNQWVERNMTERDFFLLWAGAAVSLSEIWAGGLLVSFGLVTGMILILLGHALGNVPMTMGGLIGSRHGVPSIVSTRGALGNRGSVFPALLNGIQLVGWTAVMLWIGGQAAAGLSGGRMRARAWIVALGVLTTLWALARHRIWKGLQKVGIALLLLLSMVMTVLSLRTYGWRELWVASAAPTMSFMLGLDLVIAMPISWMPLVSDYTRHAAVPGRGLRGTGWGYFLVSSWMFAVGLIAAVATGSDAPQIMLLQLMGERHLLIPALLIVLLSTLTTTFLDIYSNAVSAQSLFPKWGTRPLALIAGCAGTLLALFFDATRYEGFLLLIGSAFCPLFGVVLTDYFILKKGHYEAADLYRRGRYWYTGGFNLRALVVWIAGFLLYRICARSGFVGGSSLPSMGFAAAFYLLLHPSVFKRKAIP
ncbi:MAG: putative hydroxymethylpyrimidine transporter CytX [Kiritimatiellia bacterium]|nr:putative hydroxymethylpyrimidine transporter CytX [Kiritimatiellia bacterium]